MSHASFLLRSLLFCVLIFATFPAFANSAALPEDQSSAAILAYSRIGEDQYPETNLRTDQFLTHINELRSQRYNIIALPALITAIHNRDILPARTVAITLEGGYKSALQNAVPVLLENNIPFTIFFASDYADTAGGQYLDWDDLKSLKNNPLVTIGILPASYEALADQPPEKIKGQVHKAKFRYRQELGQDALLFSYPFGEYSKTFRDIVAEQGFSAAFGLHSGAVFPGTDLYTLPRFSMTEGFGDLQRLQLVAGALPLPTEGLEPADPYIDTPTPSIGFSIPARLGNLSESLSCFVSGQDQPHIEHVGQTRIELRLKSPLTEERTRINCTMPGPVATNNDEPPRWRWLGMLLLQKQETAAAPSLLQDEPQ